MHGSRRIFLLYHIQQPIFEATVEKGCIRLVSASMIRMAHYIMAKFECLHQFIRYGLVARICRSHQSSSLPSAGKARVRFPVSESFFLPFEHILWCGVVVVVQSGVGFLPAEGTAAASCFEYRTSKTARHVKLADIKWKQLVDVLVGCVVRMSTGRHLSHTPRYSLRTHRIEKEKITVSLPTIRRLVVICVDCRMSGQSLKPSTSGGGLSTGTTRAYRGTDHIDGSMINNTKHKLIARYRYLIKSLKPMRPLDPKAPASLAFAPTPS
jgi:hypothetical protein